MDYARSAAGQAREIILVHGEEDAAEALIGKLGKYQDIPTIHFPDRLTSFDL